MQPFRIHTGKVAPLERANVDTDQIVPKQFLKRIERTGYGEFLFFGWRYRQDGVPDPAFLLNEPRYREASILLAGQISGAAPHASMPHGRCWSMDFVRSSPHLLPTFSR